MNKLYKKRPAEPLCKVGEIQFLDTPLFADGYVVWDSWPLSAEAQMWLQARCHRCGNPAHWVGTGTPFDDGQQHYVASDAWCYWCFPSELLTEEDLRVRRHAEWARQETVNQIVDLLRQESYGFDVEEFSFDDLIYKIEAATKI